jgi:hypothetical protein
LVFWYLRSLLVEETQAFMAMSMINLYCVYDVKTGAEVCCITLFLFKQKKVNIGDFLNKIGDD